MVKKKLSIIYMRGGGNLADACRKHPSSGGVAMPPGKPSETASPGSEADNVYAGILERITAIPEDDMLILKVGCNDNPAVNNNAADHMGGSGTSGKAGNLFVEYRTKDRPLTTTAFKVSDVPVGMLMRYFKLGLKKIGQDNNRLHLVAVSPMPKYGGFSYPFEYLDDTEYEKGMSLFNMHYMPDANRTYLQKYFPIGPNFNPETHNYKLLNYLINRPGPLFIFNAMGSHCYQSFKYVMDMRTNLRSLITYYGGLVDGAAECELGIPIYPNPVSACEQEEEPLEPAKVGGSRKSKSRKRKTRRQKKSV